MERRIVNALIRRVILFGIIVLIAMCIINDITFTDIKNNVLRKFYKIEYSGSVQKYSIEYDVDKYLIYAIIKAESNFKVNAESGKSAKGLMQLMSSTAEEISKEVGIDLSSTSLFDADTNINLGTKYISNLLKKYNSLELALAAYNAGSGNVDSWINLGLINSDGSDVEKVPYNETNNYIRKILRDYDIYKELYEGEKK